MPRVNTKQAKELLEMEAPFTTNGSLSAVEVSGNYLVLSYGTAIGYVDHDSGVTYLNTAQYSATTSKHQRIAKEALTLTAVVDGYLVEEISDPVSFENETGQRARIVGANRRDRH